MEAGTIRQVLLITDGGSNSGEDPVVSARRLWKAGITVNVIGIVDRHHQEQAHFNEIEAIAREGGGVSQIVYEEDLSETVQTVTVQAMSQTIQGIVNKELTQIFGTETQLEDIAPEERAEVVELVEEMGETVNLEVLILVDTSASMHHKLPTVKEALLDLSYNLQARKGENQFAIFQYPHQQQIISPVAPWTKELQSMSVIFPKLQLGGVTPTGPALTEALKQFSHRQLEGRVTDVYDSEEI